jgi:short subunit dehydrogenase-like uncharacterized protein
MSEHLPPAQSGSALGAGPAGVGGWMIYGATGYTGRLVTAEAVRRGQRPVLAGRNGAALATLAAEHGLEAAAFPLDDPAGVRRALAGLRLVLHCAGPFVRTSAPMVSACLDLGVHYLDITGEIAVFERVLAMTERARAAGTVLLPGVGFDVVPTDCLAATLAAALPEATHLDLAFAADRGGWSAGTIKTMIESLPGLGAVRRDGRIVPVPAGHATLDVPFSDRTRRCVTIPWGDVATAFHTTGIPNIRTFAPVPARLLRGLKVLGPLLPLAGLRPVKRVLQRWVERTVAGPDERTRASARAHLWGRVRDASGGEATARAETPEGYTLTAAAAVECVLRVLDRRVEPGAWTPAAAFGAGFLASLPGTSVSEVERGVTSSCRRSPSS